MRIQIFFTQHAARAQLRLCFGKGRILLCAKMSAKKKDLDSKKKRKRVVVESESGDDDSDEDLEEVCVHKMFYFAW